MALNISTASEADLRTLPGMGSQEAALLIMLRRKYDCLTPELLSVAIGGTVSPALLEMISFSVDGKEGHIQSQLCAGAGPKIDNIKKEHIDVTDTEGQQPSLTDDGTPTLKRVCFLKKGDIHKGVQQNSTPSLSIDSYSEPQILVETHASTKSVQGLPEDCLATVCPTASRAYTSSNTQQMPATDLEREKGVRCPSETDWGARHLVEAQIESMMAGCREPNQPVRTESPLKIDSALGRTEAEVFHRPSCAVGTKRASTQESLKISVVVPEKKRKMTRDLSPPKRSAQRMARRKRNATCCVPGCTDEGVVYQKVHALTCHIPAIFDSRIQNPDEKVQNMRAQALIQVATWLLGRPGSLQELVHLVDMQHCLDGYEPVTPASPMWLCMTTFCKYLGHSVPRKFTLSPVNSVAALLHWRVLYMLSALLPAKDREYWKCRFVMPEDTSPMAVDSHFHADRLRKAAKVLDVGIDEILSLGIVKPGRKIRLAGAVANFCDPDWFPSSNDIALFPPKVIVSVGIHPKHAARSHRYIADSLDRLSSLLACPNVSAVGEVGLDHSMKEVYWPDQMSLLCKVLPMVPADKVLVLHCQGIPGDNGMEVHLLLLHLLRNLPRNQKIHLHSFQGNVLVMNWWLEAFPETCFSFNREVEHFSQDQVEALVALEERKVLLETDAPHFSQRGREFSAPLELYDVAEMVASHRLVSTEHVLAVTKDNALRLYGKNALS